MGSCIPEAASEEKEVNIFVTGFGAGVRASGRDWPWGLFSLLSWAAGQRASYQPYGPLHRAQGILVLLYVVTYRTTAD